MPGLSFLHLFSRRHHQKKTDPAAPGAAPGQPGLPKPAPPHAAGAVSLIATTTTGAGHVKDSKRRESKVRGGGHPSAGLGAWRRGVGGAGGATPRIRQASRAGRFFFFSSAVPSNARRRRAPSGPPCGAPPAPPPPRPRPRPSGKLGALARLRGRGVGDAGPGPEPARGRRGGLCGDGRRGQASERAAPPGGLGAAAGQEGRPFLVWGPPPCCVPHHRAPTCPRRPLLCVLHPAPQPIGVVGGPPRPGVAASGRGGGSAGRERASERGPIFRPRRLAPLPSRARLRASPRPRHTRSERRTHSHSPPVPFPSPARHGGRRLFHRVRGGQPLRHQGDHR